MSQIVEGTVFGRLTVVRCEGRNPSRFLCKCSCGNALVTRGSSLRMGYTRSCGCLQKEGVAGRSWRHGNAQRAGHSAEYEVWHSIMVRLAARGGNNWDNYGARGITVCERWRSFKNFLADMGPRPGPGYSIDRKDNDGNYEPGNCRWATASEQAKNRRPRHRDSLGRFNNMKSGWAGDAGAIVLVDGEVRSKETASDD